MNSFVVRDSEEYCGEEWLVGMERENGGFDVMAVVYNKEAAEDIAVLLSGLWLVDRDKHEWVRR